MKDNTQIGRLAQIGLGLTALASLVISIVWMLYLGQLSGSGAPNALNLADKIRMMGYVSIGNSALIIFTIITFIAWMYRSYNNLNLAGITTTNNASWAVWVWFIPIINLFRPLAIIKEIWEQVQLIPFDVSERPNVFLKSSNLCTYWWILFIFRGIISWIGSIIFSQMMGTEGMYYSLVFSGILSVLAAILAILVIQRILSMENEARIALQLNEIGGEKFDDIDYFSDQEK